MTTYYLQDGYTDSSLRAHSRGDVTTLPDARLFIDAHLHGPKDCPNQMVQSVEAESWLEARAALFPY